MASGGVSKVLLKLQKSVQEGNYYEAHQMYHSVSQRYLKQKKTPDALNLLQEGARNMLLHGQINSGLDLFTRLLDVFESQALDVNEDTRDRIMQILLVFPLASDSCDEFIRLAVKWASKKAPLGDPSLHHALGNVFFQAGHYYEAESHFALGTVESAKTLGLMAQEWGTREKSSLDRGYFIARSVFQLLALGKVHGARACLDTYMRVAQLGDAITVSNVSITQSSFLNLTQLMLVCVERGNKDTFKSLLDQFRAQFLFDSFLSSLVDDYIAPRYFDTGNKKAPNPLEEMMKNLFGPAKPGAPHPLGITPNDMD